MAITVRRLTTLPELGLTLVAGRDGADRVIEWAHPIELPDPTPWLSGGELVMTTGLEIGAGADDQFTYLQGLVGAGCVALAFDTGTRFDRVPDGLRAAGDALGFPVLAVPASTPFVAITRAVIDELTADQVRAVQRVVDQQERLARATLRGGVPAVVTTLGQALAGVVAVVDPDDRVLAEYGSDTTRAIGHARAVSESASRSPRRRQMSKVLVDDGGHYTVQSIAAAPDVYGYLAVGTAEPLPPADRLLLAHAVSLISIELGKPAKVQSAEQRLRAVVTRTLFDAPERMDAGLLRYFGLEPTDTVAVAVLTEVGPLLPAERQVGSALAPEAVPYLAASVGADVAVVLPADRAREIATRVQHRVRAQLSRPVRCGLGGPCAVMDAKNSVHQALSAARAARDGGTVPVVFAELGTFSLLLGMQDPDALHAIARSGLEALDAYDEKRGGSGGLVETLAAYLEHNAQAESAAVALGIHRHTLRNRLARIAELTGRDPDSIHTRVEWWLAVKAREMLDRQEE
ncbi:PucR family transcriptional regulator [Rhodococcus zopfii]|uniref:PucR family transcriptional regulator n=1 Tax=Rhodococcus zopfii TaxID=43772 RepID=UPI00111152CC|nr:PucR family transcriptional regulator [Rhodococcus zopfii]